MEKKATIEDVKKAKIDLESEVCKMVQDFEKKYGMKIGYMSIQRKNDSKIVSSRPDAPRYSKPMSVDISMNMMDMID